MADPSPARPSPVSRTAIAIVVHSMLVLAVSVFLHPTPLYFVETDLVGEYIPSARELLAGQISAERFAFKGPGYPLLLAAVSIPCGGDLLLAARVLGALASGAAAYLAYRLALGWVGAAAAAFALALLLANPTFVRYGIEAGTDLPAMALMLAATVLLLQAPGGHGALAAGLATGLAVITRYNAAFLIPAAVIVLLTRPQRLRTLAAFAAGIAATLGLWLYINAGLGGGALRNRNYLNIAYELYGRDLPWDRFEAEIGSRFASLRDVLLFDPATAAARVARNVFAHFVTDLRELTPWWVGALSFAGGLLGVRHPAWRLPLVFFAGCSLALAPVFYSARFNLYLLPFHLAAAGALLFAAGELVRTWRIEARQPAWLPSLRMATAIAVTLVSAGFAVGGVAWHLARAPHEARAAGQWLRDNGHHGRIMARKPHVAYFAGMGHVAMGPQPSLAALLSSAREAGARYLLFSPIEHLMRGEYAVLGDSGLALPGLEQITYRVLDERRYFAIYRVDSIAPDSSALAAAFVTAVLRHADRHEDVPAAQVFAGYQLAQAGRPRDALARLLPLERAGIADGNVEALISTSYLAVGEADSSYAACERAMKLLTPTSWHHIRLATIHEMRGEHAAARAQYDRALALEPGSAFALERLGLTLMALRDPARAAPVFERLVRLDPLSVNARRYAIGALQMAGDPERARQIMDEGVRAGIPVRQLLDGVRP